MEAISNFRRNLRTAMEHDAISQRMLAERIETGSSYVNRVLQGTIEPGLDNCDRLARAVGYPLYDLLLPPDQFAKRLTAKQP